MKNRFTPVRVLPGYDIEPRENSFAVIDCYTKFELKVFPKLKEASIYAYELFLKDQLEKERVFKQKHCKPIQENLLSEKLAFEFYPSIEFAKKGGQP
ncbi:MAG: hypothetical protein H6581_19960 [Bacteroidia bacterium]|nr:hypothetical protein [Bacteroidia bacterium]